MLISHAVGSLYLLISSPPFPPKYINVPSELNCIFLKLFSSPVKEFDSTLLVALDKFHGIGKSNC